MGEILSAKGGLIDSPKRGRFVISEAGRELLARNLDRIDNDTLMEFPSFRDFRTAQSNTETGDEVVSSPVLGATTATPEESIETAYASLQASLRSEILGRILQNSPSFFESVIVNLLVAMGYGGSHKNAASQLGKSGDGGVDGVINEDRLGLDRVYVQAKRYAAPSTIGRPEVQSFVGSLVGLGASKGVFVTTSTFSSQAQQYVKQIPQRVILIDGQRLADLMIEHNVGLRVDRTLEFKRLDEDFFGEED